VIKDGKFEIDAGLARELVARQFPQWADLPIRPVEWDGWDNRTFRLGEEMSVRLPSAPSYVAQVEKEHRWLPELAPLLPLPIPVPLAMGSPAEIYPWPWSVYKWIEGQTAAADRINDIRGFAVDIAEFLRALQRINAVDGPPAGKHNFFRGGPLSTYDAETRETVELLRGEIDTAAAIATWEAALAAEWRGSPVWVHGDIAVGNLLVKDGRLSAVIDFGTSAVGDPACDLVLAWTFLAGESREAFRATLRADDATWARARGWALWKGLLIIAHDIRTNPAEAPARRVVGDVLAEHRAST
jgi:aminoglycoside phosphotransferase (APT) family kinase protein